MAHRGGTRQVKGFHQAIKDLRRDLEDGGLAWAHATESAGKYLQTIVPGVCDVAAEIRGSYRHTSSEDKYDLKKVVTTRFYSADGSKMASCHAHGDGTWNILFTGAGKAQLAKMDLSTALEDALEVTVFQRIDKDGRLFHYGEMISKPDACRRPAPENNDERHRLKQAEIEELNQRVLTELFPRRIPRTEEVTTDGGHNSKSGPRLTSAITTSRPDVGKPQYSRYNRDDSLTPDQQQLAVELAKGGLTGKEQRSLFQKLKPLPLEQQELILERSKSLKLQNPG